MNSPNGARRLIINDEVFRCDDCGCDKFRPYSDIPERFLCCDCKMIYWTYYSSDKPAPPSQGESV